jgi:hypothetical protein
MPYDVWPVGLPQNLMLAGHQQAIAADTLLRTPMDKGPPKVRSITDAAEVPLAGQITISYAQWSTLRTFYRTTLGNGALPFTWVDPLTDETVDMRFTAPPVSSGWDYQYGTVSLQLEILP